MSYAIGAAGTGGHVFPGLAVAEALVDGGVEKSEITFFGGNRLEKQIYPSEGFPFVEVDIRGLQRSLRLSNLSLPFLVRDAVRVIEHEIRARDVRVAMAMGSYVTVPLGWAARRAHVSFFLHEQNASPGLANRVMAKRAAGAFVSFPGTSLTSSIEVGNPIRRSLLEFSRAETRPSALGHYELDPDSCVVGIVGGSLGAGVLNDAAAQIAFSSTHELQLLHICGPEHVDDVRTKAADSPVRWRVVGFETEMNLFYAACDLVVARGGGMVAELLATGTPSVLVPGAFGSGGHQDANAAMASEAGAALVLVEADLSGLSELVRELCSDRPRLQGMSDRATAAAKPEAAERIAAILMGRHA
ncbi:MAG: glycosyltransferase [Acidimicrobiia bacterium]